jgi:hypothetical protein
MPMPSRTFFLQKQSESCDLPIGIGNPAHHRRR